jgi:hypothetical protein
MTDGLLVGGLVAPVIGAEVSCGRSGSPSRSTRDEHVPPLLPRPFVDEHVDAVPLLDFKAGREHLEPAMEGPPSQAMNMRSPVARTVASPVWSYQSGEWRGPG